MDVFILRVRKDQNKKDYLFDSISNAAIFEENFFKHKETEDLKHELFYRDIPESKKLLKELSYDPEYLSEKEFLRWFYPDQLKKLKKKVSGD